MLLALQNSIKFEKNASIMIGYCIINHRSAVGSLVPGSWILVEDVAAFRWIDVRCVAFDL
jgi:hypothetical protein